MVRRTKPRTAHMHQNHTVLHTSHHMTGLYNMPLRHTVLLINPSLSPDITHNLSRQQKSQNGLPIKQCAAVLVPVSDSLESPQPGVTSPFRQRLLCRLFSNCPARHPK